VSLKIIHFCVQNAKNTKNNLDNSQNSCTFAPAFRARSVRTRAFMYNNLNLKSKNSMIIVPVKEGENIEKALKKFKRKFEKTGVVKELRRRQQFDKPSVLKRLKMEHAVYVQKLRATEE
jgi:small subunit ribosomal protein S21